MNFASRRTWRGRSWRHGRLSDGTAAATDARDATPVKPAATCYAVFSCMLAPLPRLACCNVPSAASLPAIFRLTLRARRFNALPFVYKRRLQHSAFYLLPPTIKALVWTCNRRCLNGGVTMTNHFMVGRRYSIAGVGWDRCWRPPFSAPSPTRMPRAITDHVAEPGQRRAAAHLLCNNDANVAPDTRLTCITLISRGAGSPPPAIPLPTPATRLPPLCGGLSVPDAGAGVRSIPGRLCVCGLRFWRRAYT